MAPELADWPVRQFLKSQLRFTVDCCKCREGADEHIDRLAEKYLGLDAYPARQPGEQRITYVVDATRIRHQKQG